MVTDNNVLAGILPESMPSLENLDIIGLIESKLVGLLPDNIAGLYNAHRLICLLGFAFLLLLLAVQGYKIFKSLLYVAGAIGFAYVGYTYLMPYIPANALSFIPEWIDSAALVAVACALVAVFLTRCAFPLMISILGAGTGYLLGTMLVYPKMIAYFSTLTFLQGNTFKYIIGGVLAAMLGIIFLLMFKHLFMVATSFACPVVAALAIQKIVMPAANQTIVIAFAIVGIAFGIYCVVHQYKQEEKDMEIVF